MSIKNDGHYFCRAGGNRPDGLNEPVTIIIHFAYKKNAPGRERKPVTSASNEGLTSGAAG
ncbi:hypothetical protein GQV62_003626 [Salmonella enterica]|nr:hypothetical protein [Salmonella enterica subsp. enterica serovar Kentucky]